MPLTDRITALGYGIARGIANIAFALLLLAAPARAEPVTIVALGDSLTAGYGLPADQGLVPQLQRWLDGQGAEAVVINAGVSGDTSAGGLARLDWSLTPETDALIVTLGGNDLLRGLDPAVTRANLAAILEGAKARGLPVLLVGLEASGNYGPAYKAAFDAIWPELAAEYGAVLMDSFFAPFGSDPAGFAAFMQADGIHPDAEGVARVVGALGPKVVELIAAAGG
jgi:acyl-CoA thioesterase I